MPALANNGKKRRTGCQSSDCEAARAVEQLVCKKNTLTKTYGTRGLQSARGAQGTRGAKSLVSDGGTRFPVRRTNHLGSQVPPEGGSGRYILSRGTHPWPRIQLPRRSETRTEHRSGLKCQSRKVPRFRGRSVLSHGERIICGRRCEPLRAPRVRSRREERIRGPECSRDADLKFG